MLSSREKRDFCIVSVLGAISATAELFGIAAIIPVIQILLDEGAASQYADFIEPVIGVRIELNAFEVACAAILILLCSVCVNLLYIFSKHRYSKRLAARFSSNIFENFLLDNISKFYSRPQAGLVVAVEKLGTQISEDVLLSALHVISRLWLLLLVVVGMLYVNLVFTAVISSVLVVAYLFIHAGVRRYIKLAAKENYKSNAFINRVKIDAYQGYRQIHVGNLIGNLITSFTKEKKAITRKEANINIVGEVPRVALEAIGLICLILGALYLHDSANPEKFLPSLAFFAASAYRVLPAVQQIYHSTNKITSVFGIVDRLAESLVTRQSYLGGAVVGKNERFTTLRLENVSFKYDGGDRNIFTHYSKEISLQGMSVIVGESGRGKSTLFDLILGFREPLSGIIYLNEFELNKVKNEWWEKVAYIPQDFHIFGETVKDVLVVGRTNVTDEKLNLALECTGLNKILNRCNMTLESDGLLLQSFSGGEKCRLAIAVALISGKPIVIADEPFAALDITSAHSVLAKIQESFPELCWLIISHRLEELPGDVSVIKLS